MTRAATIPGPGAGKGSVPKKGIGMAFRISGVPGRAGIAQVDVPSASAAGRRWRGTAPSRKSARPMGPMTKTAAKSETPPQVTGAPARTTARMARSGPRRRVIGSATARTGPLSSMSVPSRTSGKNAPRSRPRPA